MVTHICLSKQQATVDFVNLTRKVLLNGGVLANGCLFTIFLNLKKTVWAYENYAASDLLPSLRFTPYESSSIKHCNCSYISRMN